MATFQLDFMDSFEDQDDPIETLTAKEISQVVLYSSDWTTQTIISQLTQENIDLSPRFQRRDAWNINKKSRFIESLILGIPVPEIVLAEKKDERGKFLVLDGKQRLLTLLQFIGVARGKNNKFKLTGLDVRKDLEKFTFDDLQNNSAHRNDWVAFNNSTIRSVVIRNWPKAELLHMIFVRLNTGSVPLSPQELRQALYPGKFVDFISDQAEQSQAVKILLGISEPDFRMRDIELMVRYIGFKFFLSSYAGNLRTFLDDTCDVLNREWEKREKEITESMIEFENAIQAMVDIFGEANIARKWTGTEFENRPNRAVLDIMAFYFSNETTRNVAKKNGKLVVDEFKKLCVSNDGFRKSIETTTKSLTATHDRFFYWGDLLRRTLNLKIVVPDWNDEKNRIV